MYERSSASVVNGDPYLGGDDIRGIKVCIRNVEGEGESFESWNRKTPRHVPN